MNFIYIDMKDGTGGFMIPDDEANEEVIEELLNRSPFLRVDDIVLKKTSDGYVCVEA